MLITMHVNDGNRAERNYRPVRTFFDGFVNVFTDGLQFTLLEGLFSIMRFLVDSMRSVIANGQ